MTEYYIVSLEKTRANDGCLSLLRPDRLGVTHLVAQAGRYSEAEVNADLSYYDNGDKHIAILCQVLERHAQRMVPLGAFTSGQLVKDDLQQRALQ